MKKIICVCSLLFSCQLEAGQFFRLFSESTSTLELSMAEQKLANAFLDTTQIQSDEFKVQTKFMLIEKSLIIKYPSEYSERDPLALLQDIAQLTFLEELIIFGLPACETNQIREILAPLCDLKRMDIFIPLFASDPPSYYLLTLEEEKLVDAGFSEAAKLAYKNFREYCTSVCDIPSHSATYTNDASKSPISFQIAGIDSSGKPVIVNSSQVQLTPLPKSTVVLPHISLKEALRKTEWISEQLKKVQKVQRLIALRNTFLNNEPQSPFEEGQPLHEHFYDGTPQFNLSAEASHSMCRSSVRGYRKKIKELLDGKI